jgi:hypothetical protein
MGGVEERRVRISAIQMSLHRLWDKEHNSTLPLCHTAVAIVKSAFKQYKF